MTERILGYPAVTAGPAEVADQMVRRILGGEGCQTLARIAPHACAGALAGPRVSAALAGTDWLVPEGVGVVLASRLLGLQTRDGAPEHDVFSRVLEKLDRRGGRGPRPLHRDSPVLGVLEAVRRRCPGAAFVFTSTSKVDGKHAIFWASKAAADVRVQKYGRYFGMKPGVFRGAWLSGERH